MEIQRSKRTNGVVARKGCWQEPLWKPQPYESGKMYTRFELFLSLGPQRTVTMAHKKACEDSGALYAGQRVETLSTWKYSAQTWGWPERAKAWDEYNRGRMAERNEARRVELRERRIGIISEQLDRVEKAMRAAALDDLTAEQARAMLPTLRLLLRDMLEQQRVNVEPLAVVYGEEQEILLFTADDLLAATRELETQKWGLGLVELEGGESVGGEES